MGKQTIQADTVAEAYLAVLADRGVDYLFGNAGTDVCLNAANMDPSCELFTHATLASFTAFDDGNSLVIRWVTSSETGTAGFYLYGARNGEWEPLHEGILPALESSHALATLPALARDVMLQPYKHLLR